MLTQGPRGVHDTGLRRAVRQFWMQALRRTGSNWLTCWADHTPAHLAGRLLQDRLAVPMCPGRLPPGRMPRVSRQLHSAAASCSSTDAICARSGSVLMDIVVACCRRTSESLSSDACCPECSAALVCRGGAVDSRPSELCRRLNMLVVRLAGSREGPAVWRNMKTDTASLVHVSHTQDKVLLRTTKCRVRVRVRVRVR